MKIPRGRRPSPALAVSVIALCGALVGVAAAEPTASRVAAEDSRLTQMDRRATVKIARALALRYIKRFTPRLADRRITRRARALSVANARTVDDGAIGTQKLADDAVTGEKLNESTLGTVPTAAEASVARDSEALDGLSVAQVLGAAKPSCPPGTTPAIGVCVEDAPRASLAYLSAAGVCKEASRRLPSQGELLAYGEQNISGLPPEGSFEWSEPFYYDEIDPETGTPRAVAVGAAKGELSIIPAATTVPRPFRCVVAPS